MTPYDAYIAQSAFLSVEAKALYSLIRSLPTTHLPTKSTLATYLRIGRNRTSRALSELRKLGLLVSVRRRDPTSGQVVGEYLIFVPQDRRTASGYSGWRRKE